MAWDELAIPEILEKTSEAIKERGIQVSYVATGKEALSRLRQMIPAGAEVMVSSSTTLDQIGFTDLLKSGQHPWRNLRATVLGEKDPGKQTELRRQSTLAQYWVGSVHAVAQTGELVTASASGSQLPPYAFSSPNVILVVGTQKITPDLPSALRRIREYTLPLEDARMKRVGYPGSFIGKVLIMEQEFSPNRVSLMFVGEKLGF